MTGVKGGKDEHDMVLLRHITNVSDHREGMFHHTVDVQTSAGSVANTISYHVSHDEAAQFRQAIVDAISALHARAEAPISVVVERPSAPPPSAGGTDLAAQLQQLAGLRDAGILTEEEFAAKKSEILSRF
jgi:hypothetical protein